MIDDCEHEWSDEYLRLDGTTTQQCIKCPRWRMKHVPGRRSRDPENTRRSMEETSRYLGEHRDN